MPVAATMSTLSDLIEFAHFVTAINSRLQASPLDMSKAWQRSPGRPSSPSLFGIKSYQRSQDFSWKMSGEEKYSKKKNVFDASQSSNFNERRS